MRDEPNAVLKRRTARSSDTTKGVGAFRQQDGVYVATDSVTGLPYIFDWGVVSLSKLSYPIQQYWQRSKVLRDDGVLGRTIFVKDRLVGPNACRIVIDTYGDNNADYFMQYGSLTISTTPPMPEYQFDF